MKGKWKSIATMGLGGIAANLVMIVSLPIISRLYSPEAYSAYIFLLSLSLFFSVLGAFRYELSIVLAESVSQAATLFYITAILSFLSAIISFFLLPFLAPILRWSHLSELKDWLWIISVMIFSQGLFQVSWSWLTRNKEFTVLAIAQVIPNLLTVSLQIGLALYGINDFSGLSLGTIGGSVGTAVPLFLFCLVRYRNDFYFKPSRKEITNLLRKYKEYPLSTTPNTLVSTLQERVGFILMGSYGSPTDIGLFRMAHRLLNIPVGLLANALRPIFFQTAAQEGFKSLEPLIFRTFSLVAKISPPILMIFILEAPGILAFCFGENWRSSGTYASILAFPMFLLAVTNWLDRGFDSLGQQKLSFHLEILFSVTSMAGWFLGLVILKDVRAAALLIAVCWSLYYLLWTWTLFHRGKFDLKPYRLLLLQFLIECLLFLGLWAGLTLILGKGVATLIYTIATALFLSRYLRAGLQLQKGLRKKL